jgi:hypothetical protein
MCHNFQPSMTKFHKVEFAELRRAARRDTQAYEALCRYTELRDRGVLEPDIRYSVVGGYVVADPKVRLREQRRARAAMNKKFNETPRRYP